MQKVVDDYRSRSIPLDVFVLVRLMSALHESGSVSYNILCFTGDW